MRLEADPCAVRRVPRQKIGQACGGSVARDAWRQPETQADRRAGPHDIAGVADVRKATGAGHGERGTPGPVEHEIDQVVSHRPHAFVPRESRPDAVADDGSGSSRLLDALHGNLRMQPVRKDRTVRFVLQPRQQHAQNAEARRDDAAGVAGVDAFADHVDVKIAGDHAAQ